MSCPAILSRQSFPVLGCPVLVSWLSFPDYTFLAVPSWPFDCPILAVMSWLSRLGRPVLEVLPYVSAVVVSNFLAKIIKRLNIISVLNNELNLQHILQTIFSAM
jgi:hypothetical protein